MTASTLEVTKYILPNGKRVVIIQGCGGAAPTLKDGVFQQWPGQEFERIDAEILRHTPVESMMAEKRSF